MKFLWNDEALTEYERAAEYYGLKEIGLDERFADCIETVIEAFVWLQRCGPLSKMMSVDELLGGSLIRSSILNSNN